MTLHTTNLLVLAGAALLWAGCAGPEMPPEERTDQAIAKIQVHEANLSRDHAIVERGDADCAARCQAARGVCEEEMHICQIAEELADTDAIARCGQAGDVCQGDRQRTADDCACGTDAR